jgi:hypothetical protein
MKASIGDQIVVVPPHIGGVVRDCLVLEVRNPDGSPPYVVRWSDTGQEALYFPGSDGRVTHLGKQHEAEPPEIPLPHVTTWRVEIQVFEQGRDTTARAVLLAGSDTPLESRGHARRAPEDKEVPEVGDEVAVSRALRHLADNLLQAAAGDLSELEHRDVKLVE